MYGLVCGVAPEQMKRNLLSNFYSTVTQDCNMPIMDGWQVPCNLRIGSVGDWTWMLHRDLKFVNIRPKSQSHFVEYQIASDLLQITNNK